jgi:hypothetical protein
VTEYGEETTKEFYKILSEWKQDKDKSRWRKDDNRSIKRWVVDAWKKNKPKDEKKYEYEEEEFEPPEMLKFGKEGEK